ncbi:MAG: aminotransferase class I/II-fold pyridoxal phosphate-dependent enzyme [Woeseiaceae bacterium]|nr:aminotransferase class I/II-fold pyridoxal phosphate-dependent enzyme [Woeseiaceae bacterium]
MHTPPITAVLSGLLVFFAFASGAAAQDSPEAAVWSAVERQWRAERDGDESWVDELLSADFVGWPKESPAPRNKTSTRLWNAFNAGQTDILEFELYPQSIVVHGNMAVVHYLYSVAVEPDGGEVTVTNGRYTDVLVRLDAEWKFISWHGGRRSGRLIVALRATLAAAAERAVHAGPSAGCAAGAAAPPVTPRATGPPATTGARSAAAARLRPAARYQVVALSSRYPNPLGVTMPDEARRELVRLVERHKVALIEDDVYGDLRFDGQRPRPADFHSRDGRVMTCGSFSKTAAPGYRIGWVLAGRYASEIERLKRSFSCSSGLLQQLTLSEFVATGDYDRYLKTLRPVLQCNAERMSALVAAHFPAETRTSKPVGGSVLWLELPAGVDSAALFDRAMAHGISIAPGSVFSPREHYRNCIRLSFGHPWSPRIEEALRWLGRDVCRAAAQAAGGAD